MAFLKDLIVTGASQFLDGITVSKINAPTSSGGTSYGAGTSGQVLLSNGSNIYWGSAAPTVTESTVSGWGFTKNGGTVTSVSATGTNGISISGSPITSSGSITIGLNLSTAINTLSEGSSPANRNDYAVVQYAGGGTSTTTYHRRKLSNVFAALNSSDIITALGNQNANVVLAGPSSGSAAAPAFRKLVAADIQHLNISALNNDIGYITSADVPEGASAYTGTIKAVGTTASNGSNNGFARGDHVHNITKATIDNRLGTGSGTTKFYREDGTWATPAYTTNTDTKVNVVSRGTTKAYLLADTTAPTFTAAAHTAVAETGVYLDTTAGKLVATTFKGNLDGTATKATKDGSGNTITSTYVKKSGDTMTGTLTMQTDDNPNIIIKNTDMDISASTLSTQEQSSFYFQDKNNHTIGYIQSYQNADSDGTVRLTLGATRYQENTTTALYSYLTLNLTKDGTHTAITNTNLKAIKAGDTYVEAQNSNTQCRILLDSGNSTKHGLWSSGYYNGSAYQSSGSWILYRSSDGYVHSDTRIYGAVYNDYAEYRETEEEIEPGRVITEVGNGKLILATKRLMRGCEVISDTFGFAIGESKKCKTPTAVSGRVLVYPYEDLEEFKTHIGWPVCSGPNGTVSIMTEEEEMKYPSRIIGTISEVPDYDIWYCGQEGSSNQREVKDRVWIRVR